MIFVVTLIIIFAAVSAYFFFRAEALQRQVISAKREQKQIQKENKAFIDSIAVMNIQHESFVNSRLSKLKEWYSANTLLSEELDTISPLIHNYALITKACFTNKGQLSVAVEKCYKGADGKSYRDFTTFISTQNKEIQRMWGSNQLKGYLTLVESLLIKFESSTNDKQLRKRA